MLVRLQLSARLHGVRRGGCDHSTQSFGEIMALCSQNTAPSSLRNQDLEKSSAGTKRTKRCKRKTTCVSAIGIKDQYSTMRRKQQNWFGSVFYDAMQLFLTWLIWDSLCRVGSDVGPAGVLGHYCDYKWGPDWKAALFAANGVLANRADSLIKEVLFLNLKAD